MINTWHIFKVFLIILLLGMQSGNPSSEASTASYSVHHPFYQDYAEEISWWCTNTFEMFSGKARDMFTLPKEDFALLIVGGLIGASIVGGAVITSSSYSSKNSEDDSEHIEDNEGDDEERRENSENNKEDDSEGNGENDNNQ